MGQVTEPVVDIPKLWAESRAERSAARNADLVLLRRMASRATILPIDTLGRATAQTYPERMLRPDGGHRA